MAATKTHVVQQSRPQKAYFIRCDWPDCRKAFGPVIRANAIEARAVAYSNRWARSGNDDRCPNHHTGKRNRRNR